MKNNNWKQIVQMHGTLRLFCNLAILKTPKGEALSAQEIDPMYHVALSKEAVTPGMLTSTMGISKTMISRLIDGLTQKGMILKKKSTTDKRSYSIVVTQKGKKEIDNAYQYYMEPIYRLQKEMGKEDLYTLFSTIEQANEILHKSNLSTF
mgnify:FL=1